MNQFQEQFKGFSSELIGGFLSVLNKYFAEVYPALTESFGWFFRSFVTLYIVCMAIAVFKGTFKDKTVEVITSMILLVGIQSLVLETTVYRDWVVTPIMALVRDLSGFFMAHSGHFDFGFSGVFSKLDMMLGKLLFTVEKLTPQGNILMNGALYLKFGFAILILIMVYTFLYGSFMAIMIMGIFSLNIMFLIGGICFFFAAFKETRFIFWAWVRGVANYALLIVFAALALSIGFFGINSSLDELVKVASLENDVFNRQFFMAIFFAIVTVILILKSPDYASMLSGGSPGSTTGIAGGVGAATSAIAGGVTNLATSSKVREAGGKGLAALKQGGATAYSKLRGIPRSKGGE